jgi:hypothetical protein
MMKISNGGEIVLKKTLMALVLAFSAATVGVAQAHADSFESSNQPQRFCASQLEQGTVDGTRTVSEPVCSVISQEDAHTKLAGQVSGNSAAADTPLMIWYVDANYGGESNVIYGDSGSCDASGYQISPSAFWARNLSSIKGIATCNYVRLFQLTGSQVGYFGLNTPTIGVFNDYVGLIKVYFV